MMLRRFQSLARHRRRRFRKRAEYSTRVKPSHAFLPEDFLPINLAGLELRDSRVPSVGAAESGAHAEATLRKVQAVTNRAPHAIVLDPADVGLIHAALIN